MDFSDAPNGGGEDSRVTPEKDSAARLKHRPSGAPQAGPKAAIPSRRRAAIFFHGSTACPRVRPDMTRGVKLNFNRTSAQPTRPRPRARWLTGATADHTPASAESRARPGPRPGRRHDVRKPVAALELQEMRE